MRERRAAGFTSARRFSTDKTDRRGYRGAFVSSVSSHPGHICHGCCCFVPPAHDGTLTTLLAIALAIGLEPVPPVTRVSVTITVGALAHENFLRRAAESDIGGRFMSDRFIGGDPFSHGGLDRPERTAPRPPACPCWQSRWGVSREQQPLPNSHRMSLIGKRIASSERHSCPHSCPD